MVVRLTNSIVASHDHSMRIFGDDVDMDQDATPTNENASRGNLSGEYEVEADVFALSVDYRF